MTADANLLNTYDMQLVAGRNFSPGGADAANHAVLINQTALTALGWSSIAGKRLTVSGMVLPVVGVVRDFNYRISPQARQRTKEIGLRKVLGASVLGVTLLLSRPVLTWVSVAVLIGLPMGWWVMNQWLQSFPYHIAFPWWLLGVAGLLAVGIALLTVSFQSIRVALMNPVNSLRAE